MKIMKRIVLYMSMFVTASFLWSSCTEEDFSENYDINLPVAKVTEASDLQPYVDDEITIKGENLNTTSTIGIGAYNFTIISTTEDGNSMIVRIPRSIEGGKIAVTNKYKRTFESDRKSVV